MRRSLTQYLPEWTHDWLEIIVPALQIVLIILVAWLLQRILRRLVRRASEHYALPADMTMVANGLVRWVILLASTLLVLERVGVSAAVLWTAFTGFATVGAVAFFAAWSVLSNLFCAMLIFSVGPFRVGDVIEVLDTADTGGARGRVIDINLLYTTLEDLSPHTSGTLLQIPNTLVFQRVVRRWRSGQTVPKSTTGKELASELSSPAPNPAPASPFAPGEASDSAAEAVKPATRA